MTAFSTRTGKRATRACNCRISRYSLAPPLPVAWRFYCISFRWPCLICLLVAWSGRIAFHPHGGCDARRSPRRGLEHRSTPSYRSSQYAMRAPSCESPAGRPLPRRAQQAQASAAPLMPDRDLPSSIHTAKEGAESYRSTRAPPPRCIVARRPLRRGGQGARPLVATGATRARGWPPFVGLACP